MCKQTHGSEFPPGRTMRTLTSSLLTKSPGGHVFSLGKNKDFLYGSSLDVSCLNFILLLLVVVTVMLSEPDHSSSCQCQLSFPVLREGKDALLTSTSNKRRTIHSQVVIQFSLVPLPTNFPTVEGNRRTPSAEQPVLHVPKCMPFPMFPNGCQEHTRAILSACIHWTPCSILHMYDLI